MVTLTAHYHRRALWIRADLLEQQIRNELQRCLPGGELIESSRQRLQQAVRETHNPERVTKVALKRLDERLARVLDLYELGDYDRETLFAKRVQINADRQLLRETAAAQPVTNELAWCRKQILDLVQVWDQAETHERARILSAIFENIKVDTVNGKPYVNAFYRPSWKPFFERRQREIDLELATAASSEEGTDRERETGLEPATIYLEGRCSTS